MAMQLSDFRIGDHIIIITRMRHGIERRAARVTLINHNDLGLVGFGPDYFFAEEKGIPGQVSGWGSFDPAKVGEATFGNIGVEITSSAREGGDA